MNSPTNPYIAGNPITGSEMFFGRQDVFRFVRETLVGRYQDNAIVLYGGRRTGKTSVLYQMGRHLDPKYVPVFVDLQAVSLGGLGEMLWGIARQAVRVLRQEKGIKLSIPSREEFAKNPEGCFYERFLDPALEALGDGHLLLMLDEAARLYEQVQAGRLEPRAFDFLRSLIQYHPHLNFIFSIGSGLEEMRGEYALLFNLCQYRKISFLDRDAAVALITKPVEEHYRYAPGAVDRILDETYGHPYYTQLVCNRLFARWARHDGDEVTPADVDAVLGEAVEQGMASLQYAWEEASDAAKVVLAALTELMEDDNRPVGLGDLRDALAAEGIALSRRAVGRALQEMVVREVLRSTREGYAFTVDLMRLWVKQYQRLEWVKGQVDLPVEEAAPAKRDWVRLVLIGVSGGLLFLLIGLFIIVGRSLEQDRAERQAYATAMYGTIEALRTQIAMEPVDSQAQRTLSAALSEQLTQVVEVATELPVQQLPVTSTVVLIPTHTSIPISTLTPTPSPTPTPTPTPTPGPALGDIWPRRTDGMVMVYVPAGKFEMGTDDEGVDYALELCLESRDDCERKWFAHEQPAHTVALDGFWIDRTEVTNEQYQRCVEAGVCEEPPGWTDRELPESTWPARPVVNVSWFDAETYCKWAGVQMPTEAQWEYAARGPESFVFPWGDEFDRTRLNYCNAACESQYASREFSDGYGGTAPVGSFPTGNSWCGAWDMAGNVWEWVADWYAGDYYAHAPSQNPTGPSSGEYRVLRGGSMSDIPYAVRSAHRYSYLPDDIDRAVGFRCASDSK